MKVTIDGVPVDAIVRITKAEWDSARIEFLQNERLESKSLSSCYLDQFIELIVAYNPNIEFVDAAPTCPATSIAAAQESHETR